jgi:amino acid adenylation domain-containing protein
MQMNLVEGFRLSPQQNRLWLLRQEHRPISLYAKCAVLLEGDCERNLLRAALAELVARHEILRTSIRFLPDIQIPLQVVEPEGVLDIEQHDLSELDADEQQRELETLLSDLNGDESSGVMKVALATLAPRRSMLLLSLPAMCADESSLENLVRELGRYYAACLKGERLAHEPMQYADVSEWQNKILETKEGEVGRAFWRDQNLTAALAITLPFEAKVSVPGFAPAGFMNAAEVETTEALTALARRLNVSLSSVLLSCWAVLLGRLTNESLLVVGTCFDGRRHLELEDALGLLAKHLPVRCELPASLRFDELVGHVDAACREAGEWQESFAWELLSHTNGNEHAGSEPFTFTPFGFAFRQEPEKFSAGDLTFSVQKLRAFVDRFKIRLFCRQDGRRLSTEFQYDSALFRRDQIERLAGHFATLLRSAANGDGDNSISRMELLTADERDHLLFSFNGPRFEAADYTIQQRFEAQVDRTPDSIAVKSDGRELSYTDLNARANQLAHYLRELGVDPEVRVGVYVERTFEAIVAILGVLKAGGAYVPVDLSYPPERIAFMLEDAGAAVIVTQRALRESLPATPDGSHRIVCLDDDSDAISRERAENLEANVAPENLAYIIYTSGSTGRPKGVAVTHANVLQLSDATDKWFHFGERDVWPLFHSVAFDFSVWELWGALLYGGRLIVVPYQLSRDPEAFYHLLADEGVTVLNQTPSAFYPLMRAEESVGQRELALRLVIFGGEGLELRSLAPWFDRHGDERPQLINMYGITETTVHVTYRPLTADDARGATSYIGNPHPGLQVYILDEELRPAPLEVPGELYVGGAGLARGYVNRPELTSSRFIADPFGGEEGARLYRSGDQVCRLPNGDISYLGRLDHQVKIRGFRIELGEIGAALTGHEAVREAIVVAGTDVLGEGRLVAYVVAGGQRSPAAVELSAYLKDLLPDYMIPSAFVMLDALPLTSNGKVDRAKLPAPESVQLESGLAYTAPRTAVEEVVAAIWGQVLGLKRIGVDNNFFQLGGHSILVTQLVSRLRSAFRLDLPLRSIFETPTVSELSKTIETLMRAGSGTGLPPITKADRSQELPLSFAQQRLWFIDQLEPGSPNYNIPIAFRLTGRLDTEALEQTLNEILRRHEVLRTVFVTANGQPRQVIRDAQTLELRVEDLTGFDAAEREPEALKRAEEEARRPFDLNEGPLVRARLLRLATEEHVVFFTTHHIVGDGWSNGVLVSEIVALYNAFAAGKRSPLPELTTQYADFAAWQRRVLTGDVLEKQLDYWRRQLGGTLPRLEIPTDRPHSMVSYRGAHHTFTVPNEVAAGLRDLSRQESASLFMTLLAAFKVLLSRYSGQEDVVVGTDIANRNHGELEQLIGFFVNQLVLRTNLSGNPSFRALLRRVREVALGAYTHQDLPFEKLVEELQPERDFGRSPLFQVKLIMQNAPLGELELHGLKLEPFGDRTPVTRFDLTFSMIDRKDGLFGSIEYSTDLFDAATVERMAEHFVVLLEGIVANSDDEIALLPVMTPAERRRMLVEWNETQTDYPAAQCIHQLFEEQVTRTPAAEALALRGERITYEELNQRANQLAHYLQELGVGPEVVVGICVERSIEMVVGLLGILKAGGAYLPLDPSYPLERLSFMLEDAAVSVVLTLERLEQSLPTHWGQTVYLDSEWDEISLRSVEDLTHEEGADNLAYIIYTSGSTGKPKGVQIQHQSLIISTAARFSYYRSPVGTFLLLPSFSFDSSVAVIFWTLCAGGTLAIPQEGTQRDPAHLARMIASERVTHLLALPSLYSALMTTARPGDLVTLRVAIVAGEACPKDLVGRHHCALPQASLFNEYGPTEGTVWSSVYEFRAEAGAVIPIGKPIPNVEIYILDQHLQPVPPGVAGELHIGGDCLARGYLNRPELTKERFIPNTFSRRAGARLYRTGDLARFLPDGNIEFLGRCDHQVKIRGYRIELGEIEATLSKHPAVETCVVVATEGETDRRLVAYFVSKREQPLATNELREHIRSELPEYMVPSVFVALESLPLTSNGKLDRRALPEPGQGTAVDEKTYVAAHTAIEEMLAGIVGQLLSLEHVGTNDSFFELGGHSLLATQLISRLRDAFGVELSLRIIFDEPTVAGMSRHVEAALLAEQGIEVAPLERVPREGPLPLSFAQQRLWLVDQLEPGSPAYNLPAAIRIRGALNVQALHRTLNEMINRHEILRTSFRDEEGTPVQIIAPSLNLDAPVEDLSRLSAEEREAEVARLAEEESRLPFDLSTGPLLRARLLRLEEEEQVVLFTMHHIISDAWSMGVFVREVAALYHAFAEEATPSLPPLPLQYADFAIWQRRHLEGATLDALLAYWKHRLISAPTLELPSARQIADSIRSAGAVQTFTLPDEISQQLKALARQEESTLFMILLAVFALQLSRDSGQEDIVLGTDIASRHRADVEQLIGFFVNQLVLRLDLSGNPIFRELLRRVREVTLGAYTHQDLPFDKLVEALKPDRMSGRTPLFRAKLVLQNAPVQSLELPGLTLEPMELPDERGTAKFDLLLTLAETRHGLSGALEYSTELFDAATVGGMLRQFETLLTRVVAEPDARLNAFEIFSDEMLRQRESEKKQRAQSNLKRFKSIKPVAVGAPRRELIKTSELLPGQNLPLVIQPGLPNVDVFEWVKTNEDFIEESLLKHGGLLLRNFKLGTKDDFARFSEATSLSLMNYMEGATPRTNLGGKIYTSTEYPPEHSIALHNELTYVTNWPMRILFGCVQPASERGETPVADVRKVLRRLDPKIVERFEKKGWMLVRNFGTGLSLTWQNSFHFDDPAQLEAYCRSAEIEFEWKNGYERLTTRQLRPALATHPKTGEHVWFNHVAFWHVSSLEKGVKEAMQAVLKEDEMPYNTYYGDGEPIEDSVVEEIREAYRQETIEFLWQKGDILWLDNMLVAHGRNPYSGERKILVAMGNAFSRSAS